MKNIQKEIYNKVWRVVPESIDFPAIGTPYGWSNGLVMIGTSRGAGKGVGYTGIMGSVQISTIWIYRAHWNDLRIFITT